MRSLRRSAIVIGLILCLSIVPTVQASQALAVDLGSKGAMELDFSSIPTHGEIQVDGRTLRIERVENGFTIREASTHRTVVISDRELAAYRVQAVEDNSGFNRAFRVSSAELFGEKEALTVEVSNSDQASFAGDIVAAGVRYPLSFRSLELPGASSAADQPYITDEITLIIQITITAAVIGTLTCAALALLQNCSRDCRDACTVCGGSVKSYTEGICGRCHCDCQISGISREIPPGGSCSAY